MATMDYGTCYVAFTAGVPLPQEVIDYVAEEQVLKEYTLLPTLFFLG